MQSISTTEHKAALRREVSTRLGTFLPKELRRSDDALFARFLALPETAAARSILLYFGMNSEPETARLIPVLLSRGKRVLLVRCLPGRGLEAREIGAKTVLSRHPYGMLEPGDDCPVVPREEIDLILTPGLCFDRAGYRLGRGGGYYDRYLECYRGVSVGLCRESFLRGALPREVHDKPVNLVVTERETCTAPMCPAAL